MKETPGLKWSLWSFLSQLGNSFHWISRTGKR